MVLLVPSSNRQYPKVPAETFIANTNAANKIKKTEMYENVNKML